MTAALSFRPRINLHRFRWDGHAFLVRRVATQRGVDLWRRRGVDVNIGDPWPLGRRVLNRSMPDGSTRVRLTPAQRAIAGRIFGSGSGANGASHQGGASLDVDNPAAASTALDRALGEDDLTPGQRRTVRVLRDKIGGLGAAQDSGPAPEPPSEPDVPATPEPTTPDTGTPADQRMQDQVAVRMLERMPADVRQQVLDGMSPEERGLIEDAVARERPEGIEGVASPQQDQAEPLPDDPADYTPAQVQATIRDAYEEVPRTSMGARLADLRPVLEARGLTREQVDQALEEMASTPGVTVQADADQKALTPEDHEAAVRFGGDDRHRILLFEPESADEMPVPTLTEPVATLNVPRADRDAAGNVFYGPETGARLLGDRLDVYDRDAAVRSATELIDALAEYDRGPEADLRRSLERVRDQIQNAPEVQG